MTVSFMKRENVRRNVARAAAALDKADPGWRDKIDRKQFDLSRTDLCILGQIFGGCCFDAPQSLKRYRAFWVEGVLSVPDYGGSVQAVYDAYQAEWNKILSA